MATSYIKTGTASTKLNGNFETLTVAGSNVLTALAPLALDDLTDVNSNGGLGEVVNDKLTYIGSTYPFITAPKYWINLSTVWGAIVFENIITPYARTIAATSTDYLLAFVGVINSNSFLITTNSLGRLTNTDSFKWTFDVQFSCSLTGAVANNQEVGISLFRNGIKVSNTYLVTTAQAGRYSSLSGFWKDTLNGSSVTGAAVANQYYEIFLRNNSGTNTINIASAYLSCTGIRVESRPSV